MKPITTRSRLLIVTGWSVPVLALPIAFQALKGSITAFVLYALTISAFAVPVLAVGASGIEIIDGRMVVYRWLGTRRTVYRPDEVLGFQRYFVMRHVNGSRRERSWLFKATMTDGTTITYDIGRRLLSRGRLEFEPGEEPIGDWLRSQGVRESST